MADDQLAEVHIYSVVKMYRVANWAGMEIRYRHGDKVYSTGPRWHPNRDDYNKIMRPTHLVRMAEFIGRLRELMAEYGVEYEHASGYEVERDARFVLGAVSSYVEGDPA